NNQEVGVDEPDVTKTDGRVMVVLRHNPVGVEVADVGGSAPRLDGFLPLSQVGPDAQLFLTGGYAVVVGQAGGGWSGAGSGDGSGGGAPGSGAMSDVVVVGLTDPSHPSVVRTFQLQGDQVGARLLAGRIVVVLRGQPALSFVYPSDGSAQARAEATQANRGVVERSTVADWLPSVSVSPAGVTRTAQCESALHPTVASGLGTVSVVSLDPARDQPGAEVTVVGNASTVYASTSSLYVATNTWDEQAVMGSASVYPPTFTTDVHGFDLSDPANPRYLGSGTVPGSLIGQYAMSEYGGYLRVATTVGSPSPPPNEGSTPQQLSNSRVTVLAPSDHALVPVGEIGGLGQGEKIYAVRFVGPLGYVVTFRQTDPLYVVDLTDPRHPVSNGQLALTGYSSFLQPLDGSLLFGVGQAVDSNYRRAGLQLSVFDVSDPGHPALRSRLEMDNASSTAENDPHALLWWPQRRLVALPVFDYSTNFHGVIVWHVGTDGSIQELARLSQPSNPPPPGPPGPPSPGPPQPAPPPCNTCAEPQPAPAGGAAMYPYYGSGVERSVVVGSLLYTVSDSGIMATSMSSWAQQAWLAYSGS
ncbi:MAG TPA: beta-propeller domain-containing protein, partial [Acidimicrobiales bacterium]|nr:beta-propeller domain-containing protein [Acidimicrobiales bacterium]